MRENADLARTLAAAAVCGLLAAILPWEALRIVFAIPLCFFLTGYALVAAAFGPRPLRGPVMLMLSLASSLAVLALGGLVLDIFDGGIRTVTWALLLVLVTIAACRVAAVRRGRHRRAARRRRPALRRADVAVASVGVLAAVAALILAQATLPADQAIGYTSLSILPQRSDAGERAHIQVISSEQGRRAYVLLIRVGRRPAAGFRFALQPGGHRSFSVPVEARGGGRVRVAASLFRRNRPHSLYRRVTSWLDGGSGRPR